MTDAVYVLDVIAGFDPEDSEATKEAAKFIPIGGYKQFLNPNGLKGKKLGVVRNPFLKSFNKSVIQAFERHLNTLRYEVFQRNFTFGALWICARDLRSLSLTF